jgi:hypothetical protein
MQRMSTLHIQQFFYAFPINFKTLARLEPSSCIHEAEILTFSPTRGRQSQFGPGLPDFSWYMIPKPEKMYKMNTKCTYHIYGL